jgi:hypothetical protein
MSPVCLRCLWNGKQHRHRHCPYCGQVVFGTDNAYMTHAWYCTGPRSEES